MSKVAEYIESVGGEGHQSAVRIIGDLERQLAQTYRREQVAYKCLNEIEEVLAMHRMRLHQEADDE